MLKPARQKTFSLIVLAILILSLCVSCTTEEDTSVAIPKYTNTPYPTRTIAPTETPRPTNTPVSTPTITPIPDPLAADVFEGGLFIMDKQFKGYTLFEIYSSPDNPLQTIPVAEDVTDVQFSPDGKVMFYVIGGDRDGDIDAKGTYWYNLETNESKMVNEDSLWNFTWSPDAKWVTAVAANANKLNRNDAIFVYDMEGNEYKAFQPKSQSYELSNSNFSIKIFGHFTDAYWFDNQNLIFRYYKGNMPKELSMREQEITENTIGTFNILNKIGNASSGEETAEEASSDTETTPLEITKIDATEENLTHAKQNTFDAVSFDGNWALFDDYFNDKILKIAQYDDESSSYIRKEFTPCPDCKTFGFVPGTHNVFFLKKGETSQEIYISSPDDLNTELAGTINYADLCVAETAANPEIEKSAEWNGVWVGSEDALKIAFTENCGGHHYVSILNLDDNLLTRLYEVDLFTIIAGWAPPSIPAQASE